MAIYLPQPPYPLEHNQYGFGGVYATSGQMRQKGYGTIRQHGYGIYRRRRGQRGDGIGTAVSALWKMGAPLTNQIVPMAKKLGAKIVRKAIKEGIKALPSFATGQNKQTVVKKIVKKAITDAVKEELKPLITPKRKASSTSALPPLKKRKIIRRVGRRRKW